MARVISRTLPLFAILLFAIVIGELSLASSAEAQRGIPVNVESVPPGATVYLDTSDGTPLGTTPLTAVRIPAGSHTLIFRMPNYEEARLTVTVRRRRETFRAVLRPLGTIEVSAGNDGARGAEVRIDGQPVGGATLGSLPIRVENLAPGRHQVQIMREGWNPFEQWVEVQGGQVVRVTALLERAAPTTGSILVSADVQGAAITLDGQPRGVTTMVIDDVPAGMHQIEIRAEGDGLRPFSQQVLVQAGQRATVSATLRTQQVSTGSIAVITDVPGAEVRINGQPLPVGTFSRDGLAPGNYVVQVIAPSHRPFRTEVQVQAGQTTSVDAQLQAELGPPGRINIVVANASGARITVDGEERTSPFVVNQPEPGTHAVLVRAEGHAEVSFTCSTMPGAAEGDSCDRQVTLEPLAVSLRVTLQEDVEGRAVLLVDGREVGQVPYEGRVSVGDHVFEVAAEGYETFRQQMLVTHGEGSILIDARLRDSSEEAAAEGTTHSALPIAMNHPMIDASIGWPYLGELRLSIGLHELFDAGFAIRSFGRITEFEGRVRFGTRVVRQLALGAQARFGGGIGPSISVGQGNYDQVDGDPNMPGRQTLPPERHQDFVADVPMGAPRFDYPVNTAFFSIEGLVSLLLEPVAAVTLWLGLDVHSDEYAASARNSGAVATYGPGGLMDQICAAPVGTTIHCSRQDMARLRLGGAVDFVLSSNFNIWFIFEGILAQPSDHRRLLSGFLADAADIRIYPRAGITYKF
jgi:hypothetical protein